MDRNVPPLTNILIIYNPDKTDALESANLSARILNKANIATKIHAYQHDQSTVSNTLNEMAQLCQAVVVLGGDGTILGVVRQLAQSPRPLLGINLGGFGFLTSCAQTELESALQYLIKSQWQIQNRYMLEARIIHTSASGDKEIFKSLALNEALITRSEPGRLMELCVGENRDSALAYKADGLILSTPTGSTGHSLSAGGPILEPHLAALIVTPISPHSLFNRPLVFGGEKELNIWFDDESHKLVMIIDGQIHADLQPTDKVTIRRSKQTFPTISIPDRTFSQVLRYKFNLRGTP